MAVTRITATRDGTGAIGYVLRPKEKDRERVRAISGSALLLDDVPSYHQTTHEQMRHVRDVNGKNGLNSKTNEKYIQAYRVIQSFGENELNSDNDKDIAKCNALGLELAKELYPDNQSLVVTHSDGVGGKLHNHIVVNAVKFTNGKSLRAKETNWNHISKVSDEVLERNDMKPIEKGNAKNLRTQAEVELLERGEYVWKDDLKERINESIKADNVTDRDSFAKYMLDEHEVDVRFRGKKKNVSYAFTDEDNKQRRIRAGRLGSDYQRENVEEMIQSKAKEVVPKVSRRRRRRSRTQGQSSMTAMVMAELNNIKSERKEDKPVFDVQAEIDAQEVKRKEQQQQRKEEQQRKDDEKKKAMYQEQREKEIELKRKEIQQRERDKAIAKEQVLVRQAKIAEREQRKAKLLSDVKYIKMDFNMTHNGNFERLGYKNIATDEMLNEEETKWFEDYKEERKQQRSGNDVGIQQQDDELEF